MATNTHSFSVDVAQFIHSINRCFCIPDQLLHKCIIGFGISFTYDGKGGIIQNGVATRYPIHETSIIRKGKFIRIVTRLPRAVFVFVFRRVSPDQQRQFFFFIISGW